MGHTDSVEVEGEQQPKTQGMNNLDLRSCGNGGALITFCVSELPLVQPRKECGNPVGPGQE